MKLTNTSCSNAKPKDKTYKMADGGGMYLEITPSGGKLWRLKYRFGGKEKLLSLGKYPQTSLLKARAERERLKLILSQGLDPSESRKTEKRERALNAENTFEAVAREWHENKKRHMVRAPRRNQPAPHGNGYIPSAGLQTNQQYNRP